MKALAYHAYGDRSVLALEELPDPGPPGAGDVRVRVLASSINPVDGKVRRGELKLIAGGHFPRRPGLDFCGVVEAVGEGVDHVAVGDRIYGAARGMSEGAFAEHVLVRGHAVARAPATLDANTAAGVPTVAVAALQVLRDTVSLAAGDALLVNGCTGGVGLYSLQIAHRIGARVTGVCGSTGRALAREFGAAEVLDYKTTDISTHPGRYRAILELSGRLPFDAAEDRLEDEGLYVDFSPSPLALVGNTIANPFRTHKHVFALTGAKTADLEALARDIDAGHLRTPPTQVFPLTRWAEAFALAEIGGVVGKVVVQIAAD